MLEKNGLWDKLSHHPFKFNSKLIQISDDAIAVDPDARGWYHCFSDVVIGMNNGKIV